MSFVSVSHDKVSARGVNDEKGPQLRELKLTVQENNQLVEWTRRHKTSQALALRARIIPACAQGVNNSEVAKGCRVIRQTVGSAVARYLEQRLDGLLLDEPRPGAPRKVDDAKMCIGSQIDCRAGGQDPGRESGAPCVVARSGTRQRNRCLP